MKTSNAQRTQIIENCFDKSMDGNLTDAQQRAFLTDGKRLRGLLINLLTVDFDQAKSPIIQVNKQIGDLNDQLQKDKDKLDRIADLLGKISDAAKALDELLAIASKIA